MFARVLLVVGLLLYVLLFYVVSTFRRVVLFGACFMFDVFFAIDLVV